MIDELYNNKQIEVGFVAVFSAIIISLFYVIISMNGVVLGNDPAVHLEKAQIFLNTQHISLANLGWTPPLYQIMLALIISLTGSSDIAYYIMSLRFLTIVVNWLLFMSIYLIGKKFFNKKVGIASAILLLFCFPVFEANQFGGYTTVLALAFMFLVLAYTPLAIDKLGYIVVAFFAAFGLVLSHQLAAFLAFFIMPPILLFMLIKSRGKNLKVVLALALGGGIAFFLYYFQAMFAYLYLVIEYVFFAIKTYAYQIPAVNFNSFLRNFGFILFLGAMGIGVSFFLLRQQRKPLYWLVLVLSLFVPFFFSQSYLVGFYMPFAWFVYYITPPLAVLAGVTTVFLFDKTRVFYINNQSDIKQKKLKLLTIIIVISLAAVAFVQIDTVHNRVMEASVYYSTTDLKAYDAGIWLKNTYPQAVNVVTTAIPGFWFQEFSGKNVTAQTELAVQRMDVAEAVLTLAYELEHPQTLVRAYQAKGDTLDENYISMDQIWNRVSFSSGSGDFVNYTIDGQQYRLSLSQFSKEIYFDDNSFPKKLTIAFTNDDLSLNKTITVTNNRYPLTITWTLTPLKAQVSHASLYLTTNFHLKYHFEEAEIPGLLDWVNPWDAPTPIKTSNGTIWAVASFAAVNLKDNYLGLYDSTNDVGFAYKFVDLPDWGNIGVLGNRQIDAVRLVYSFDFININETATKSYEMLSLSKSSYSALSREGLKDLFNYESDEFTVTSRDFIDYIKEYKISFIVYDRNQLDTQMIHSKLLQLVYSNDRYVIFKILLE